MDRRSQSPDKPKEGQKSPERSPSPLFDNRWVYGQSSSSAEKRKEGQKSPEKSSPSTDSQKKREISPPLSSEEKFKRFRADSSNPGGGSSTTSPWRSESHPPSETLSGASEGTASIMPRHMHFRNDAMDMLWKGKGVASQNRFHPFDGESLQDGLAGQDNDG